MAISIFSVELNVARPTTDGYAGDLIYRANDNN